MHTDVINNPLKINSFFTLLRYEKNTCLSPCVKNINKSSTSDMACRFIRNKKIPVSFLGQTVILIFYKIKKEKNSDFFYMYDSILLYHKIFL